MDNNSVRKVILEKLQIHIDRISKGQSDDVDVLPAVFYEVLSSADQIKLDLLAAQKQRNDIYDISMQIRNELGQIEAANKYRAESNKKLLIAALILMLINSAILVWQLVK